MKRAGLWVVGSSFREQRGQGSWYRQASSGGRTKPCRQILRGMYCVLTSTLLHVIR